LKKNKKGIYLTIVLSIFIIYLISPYLTAWRMMQAVKGGDVPTMEQYIDFDSVKESAKYQIDKALKDQLDEQPMAAMFAPMMKSVTDKILEELIDPEKLSKVIKQGKISQTNKKSKATIADNNELTNWYAFFVSPNRFLIQLDDLALYMELQGINWKVTAIGIEELMNDGVVGKKESETAVIEDVLDRNPPIKPEVLSEAEFAEITKELSGRFYLDWDYGDTVIARGNLNYLSIKDSISPIVTWGMALDKNGESILGQFSKEKKLEREKYQSANRYHNGIWSDDIPKDNPENKVKLARGILQFEMPTEIVSFVVDSDGVGVEIEKSDIAFSLNSLKNGRVSFSWYQPFELEALDPVIIIRNNDGDVLDTSGSSSSSPLNPVEEARFSRPMRSINKSLSVKGTPSQVEFYFLTSTKQVELPITAYSKPELLLGELSEPIKQTVLVEPYIEPNFEDLNKRALESLINIQYEENEDWQGKKRRSLKISLPENANSIFAKSNVNGINLLKDGENILFTPSLWQQSNNHTYHFVAPSKNNSLEVDAKFDEISGYISLKYPETLDLITIAQGETKHGVTLKGERVIFHALYDDQDLARKEKVINPSIPSYTSVFSSRSVLAYDSKGREISYLNEKHSWGGEDKELFFWGIPDYIVVKRITSWHEVKLPVSLTESDLVIVKK
jgi:hypothetical protein